MSSNSTGRLADNEPLAAIPDSMTRKMKGVSIAPFPFRQTYGRTNDPGRRTSGQAAKGMNVRQVSNTGRMLRLALAEIGIEIGADRAYENAAVIGDAKAISLFATRNNAIGV